MKKQRIEQLLKTYNFKRTENKDFEVSYIFEGKDIKMEIEVLNNYTYITLEQDNSLVDTIRISNHFCRKIENQIDNYLDGINSYNITSVIGENK